MQNLVDRFLRVLQWERYASRHTLTNYRRILTLFMKELRRQGIEAWVEVESKTIEDWVAQLNRRDHLSKASIALYISALKSFFKWYSREPEGFNPITRLQFKTHQNRLPKILSEEQIAHLVAFPGASFEAKRCRAILETLYGMGMRVSELARMKWEDILWDQRLIRVLGKGRKERQLPIGRFQWAALNEWLQEWTRHELSGEFCFVSKTGVPLSVRTIQKWVMKAAITQLKLPLSPHVLRHSFASHLLSASQNLRAVQLLLGHAQLRTTQRYTHLDQRALAKVYDNCHPHQKGASETPDLPNHSIKR